MSDLKKFSVDFAATIEVYADSEGEAIRMATEEIQADDLVATATYTHWEPEKDHLCLADCDCEGEDKYE